jgi:hypothetical protein
MTTQHLTGAYPGGYSLSAIYNGLVIEQTASVGGHGVYVGFTAAITNLGTVMANDTYSGIALKAGGSVTNGAKTTTTALTSGLVGVYVGATASATVTNFATIEGTGGVAVQFASAADNLVAEAGSTWIGSVQGAGGTLELAGGTGTLTGLGTTGTVSGAEAMTFSGFGAYLIDAGGTWTLSGTNALAAGASLTDAGSLTITGTLSSAGTIAGAAHSKLTLTKADLVGGTLQSAATVSVKGDGNILDGTTGSFTNQATLSIADKASLTIQGAIANSGTISLAAATATTRLIVGKAGATLSGDGSVVLGANAFNTLTGATASATLTNVNNTISGSGLLGDGKLVLVNEAAGLIDQTGALALTIDTGSRTITNAGTIESTGAGGAFIDAAIKNTGLLEADMGVLVLGGAVTGNGSAVINAGTLQAGSTFNENVDFSGASGTLELENAYSGAITGFSTTGGTALDLDFVAFANGAMTTLYRGTKKGGTLTVSNGFQTAHIRFVGDYTNTFLVVGPSPAGGAMVVDDAAMVPPAPSPHLFAAAMAGMAGMAGPGAAAGAAHVTAGSHAEAWRPTLCAPRTMAA